jgi:imidazolonepropionase-like amidohydrolase
MTPMQAIQAATSNAAELLGHSDLIGSIKPGRSADMVAMVKSPQPSQDFLVLASASITTLLRCYPQVVTPIDGSFVNG